MNDTRELNKSSRFTTDKFCAETIVVDGQLCLLEHVARPVEDQHGWADGPVHSCIWTRDNWTDVIVRIAKKQGPRARIKHGRNLYSVARFCKLDL